MGRGKESQDKEIKHPEEKVFWIVGLGLVTMLVVPAVFVVVFHSLEWGKPKDWAIFAAYFSGIATPVIALCSALLFYRSIIVQRDEFQKTRKEMEAATRIQQQAERSRIETSKQEQLERTIPIARENQTKTLSVFIKKCDETMGEGYDPVTGQVTRRDFSEKHGKSMSDAELDDLSSSLKSYFAIGRHVICMIREYIEFGGDIYAQLNTIIDLGNEESLITKKLAAFEIKEPEGVTAYRKEVVELNDLCQAEMTNYVVKRTKEPQSA